MTHRFKPSSYGFRLCKCKWLNNPTNGKTPLTESCHSFSADENHQQVMSGIESIQGLVTSGKRKLSSRQKVRETFAERDFLGQKDATLRPPERDSDVATIAEFVSVGENVLNALSHSQPLKSLPWDTKELKNSWRESDDSSHNYEIPVTASSQEDISFEVKPAPERAAYRPALAPHREEMGYADEYSPKLWPGDIFIKKPPSHIDNLIRATGEAVCAHEAKREYEPALQEQDRRIRLLEERERNGIEFSNRDEMLEIKASFLIQLGHFFEATQILLDLVDTKARASTKSPGQNWGTILKMARYYYLLGQSYLEQYKSVADETALDLAETYAEFAFNARLKLFEQHAIAHHLDQSAGLCAKIYEEKQDLTRADQYREYLRHPGTQTVPAYVLSLSNDLPWPNDESRGAVGDEIWSRFPDTSVQIPRVGSCSSNNDSRRFSDDRTSRSKSFDHEIIIHTPEINSMSGDGKTPLIRFISENKPDIVSKLLLNGADVHLKCASGTPPIIYAANTNSCEIVEKLLRYDAGINDTNKKGSTALHVAISRKVTYMACFLLQHGADKDFRDARGLTPLMKAVRTKNAVLVKILLKEQADVHAKTREDWSAMHYAVSANVEGIVGLLQKAGGDVNARCNGGKTPLHYACEDGKVRCAEELIKLGADITVRDEGERSPLCLAVEHSQDDLVSLLFRYGANPTKYTDKNKWKNYENEYARSRLDKESIADPPRRLGSVSTSSTRMSIGGLSSRFSRKSKRA